jgi:membrane-associated protease RseP (regulator of RpoE activity)
MGWSQVSNVGPLLRLLVLLAIVAVATILLHGWAVLVVILSLVAMVMLHEFGHFIVAKRSGMKVTEYFLGFGPRVFSFHFGETEYGVKSIPAGGYVRIVGMTDLEEVDPADEARSYRQSTFPRRLAVALAGSGMQMILALVLLWAIFALVGVPTASGVEIVGLERFAGQQSPAMRAGLRPGDVLVAIDGRHDTAPSAFATAVERHPGVPVTLEVSRDGRLSTLRLTPERASSVRVVKANGTTGPFPGIADPGRTGVIGVLYQPLDSDVVVNPFTSVGRAGSMLAEVVSSTAADFGHVFSPHGLSAFASSVISGGARPDTSAGSRTSSSTSTSSGELISVIGAIQVGAQAAKTNIGELLLILAVVDISVALINLFPMLPLDGGHVAIAIYERIRSRRGARYHADVAKLMPFAYLFLAFMLVIGIGAVYLNIVRPVHLTGG